MECAVTVSPFCCRGARGARQVTWHGCNDLMHKKKIKHPSSLIRHPHAMPPTIATPMPPQHYSPTLMIFHVTTGTNTHNNCPFAAVVNQTQKIDCFPNLVKSVWPTAPSPLCSISLAAPSPGEGAAKLSLDYCIASPPPLIIGRPCITVCTYARCTSAPPSIIRHPGTMVRAARMHICMHVMLYTHSTCAHAYKYICNGSANVMRRSAIRFPARQCD